MRLYLRPADPRSAPEAPAEAGPAPVSPAGLTAPAQEHRSLPPLRRVAPQEVIALPAWCPRPLDLAALGRRAAAWLEASGRPLARPQEVSELLFADADHTFLKSQMPIFLRHLSTGELLRDATGEPVMLGLSHPDYERELEASRKARPEIDWPSYQLDFSLFHEAALVREARPIEATLRKLRREGDLSRLFVVTARSAPDIGPALEAKLERSGVSCEGVMTVNAPEVADGVALGVSGTAARKALVMAGVIAAHAAGGRPPATVRYFEDGDDNLRKAMQLLPALFPSVRFEFYDVVHQGEGAFHPRLVARSAGRGRLMRPHGQTMSAADVEAYASTDASYATGSRAYLLRMRTRSARSTSPASASES